MGSSALKRMRSRLKAWVGSRALGRAALGAAGGYTRHATSQLAAAIAYRVLFSLVPLAAFVVRRRRPSAGQAARRSRGLARVRRAGSSAGPERPQALEGSRVTPTIAGLVALVFLLWAASGMMAAIRVAFRVIWENDLRRKYVQSKLLDFVLVLGVGLVAVVALGATLLVQVLAEIGRDLSTAIGAGTEGRAVAAAAEVLTSGALTYAILVVLYRTVPPVAPRLRAIWLPALLATVGFHVATAVYALYLARYGDVTAVYGPLGAVLGFLLVVYVGVIVILIGAELVAAWPEPDRQSGETL